MTLGETFSIESMVAGVVFHAVTSSTEGIGDMDKLGEQSYWVPDHVREYLKGLGFHLPLEAMEGHIRAWHSWLGATGDFYDYHLQMSQTMYRNIHRKTYPVNWRKQVYACAREQQGARSVVGTSLL